MSKARQLADLGNAYDDGALSNRNLIINGGMVIDQRNSGAAVASGFAVDRFEFQENGSAVFTAQRSSVAPDGFKNSLLITVTSNASATAAQVNRILQRIEGFNTAHLGFGASGAKTITLSFWVRSSLTGTYCVGFVNGAADRSYVAEYTISAANTWEYKTISILGDTAGTWATENTLGLQVTWDIGSGSDYNATADAWAAGNDWRTTNQANFANTASATFYLTGVQLEVGDTATPFEHPRSYGDELARCHRYYQKFGGDTTLQAVAIAGIGRGSGTSIQAHTPLSTVMRVIPTASFSLLETADSTNTPQVVTSISLLSTVSGTRGVHITYFVASGIVQYRPYYVRTDNSTTGYLAFDAEL